MPLHPFISRRHRTFRCRLLLHTLPYCRPRAVRYRCRPWRELQQRWHRSLTSTPAPPGAGACALCTRPWRLFTRASPSRPTMRWSLEGRPARTATGGQASLAMVVEVPQGVKVDWEGAAAQAGTGWRCRLSGRRQAQVQRPGMGYGLQLCHMTASGRGPWTIAATMVRRAMTLMIMVLVARARATRCWTTVTARRSGDHTGAQNAVRSTCTTISACCLVCTRPVTAMPRVCWDAPPATGMPIERRAEQKITRGKRMRSRDDCESHRPPVHCCEFLL